MMISEKAAVTISTNLGIRVHPGCEISIFLRSFADSYIP
jgi:hypothetical protein